MVRRERLPRPVPEPHRHALAGLRASSAGRVGASATLLAVLGAALACGREAEVPIEPPALPLGQRSAALEAPALEPYCSAADVTSSSCLGSWSYQRWGVCAVSEDGPVRAGECGPADCREHHTCTDWRFGPGTSSVEVHSLENEHRCRDRRTFCNDPCESDDAPAFESAALDALRAEIPEPHRALVTVRSRTPRTISSRKVGEDCNLFGFDCEDINAIRAACDYEIEYPNPASGQADFCGCAECQAPGCGAAPGTFVSARGLSLAELERAEPYLATSPAPTCGSCDDLALDGPESLRAKFDCLVAQRGEASLRAQVDARLRALALIGADQLDVSQRELALAAFDGPARAVRLDCEPEVSPALEPSCPELRTRELERELAICESFAGVAEGRVAPAAAFSVAGRCLELLGRLSLATSASSPDRDCVNDGLLANARQTSARLLRGALLALDGNGYLGEPDAPSLERYPELERALLLIDRWYTAERALVEAEGVDDWRAQAELSLSEMLSSFWEVAHHARRTTLDLEQALAEGAPAADVELALRLAAERADRLDRDVLRAAYRGGETRIEALRSGSVEILPPIELRRTLVSGEVLLQLTAEALTGLSRALERAEPFHDLACRLSGCGPRALMPALDTTQLSATWRALAALDDTPAGGAVAEASALERAVAALPDGAPWKPALTVVARNRAALVEAIQASTEQSASSQSLEGQRLSPALARLAALTRRAEENVRSYDATGYLSISPTRRLHANVSPSGRDATLSAIDASLRRFQSEVERFGSERRTAVSDALAQSGAQRSLDAVRRRLDELQRELERLDSESGGLGASLLRLDRGLGEAADRALGVQGALDQGEFTAVGDTRRFELRGRDGSRRAQVERQGGRIADVAALGIELGGAALPAVSVGAGELVLSNAQGEYSPLCALSQHDARQRRGFAASVSDLVGQSDGLDAPTLSLRPLPGTTIGPEGFVLERNNQVSRARSRDDDARDSGFLQAALGVVDAAVGVLTRPAGAASALNGVGGVSGIINGVLRGLDPVEDSSSSGQSDSVRFQGGLRLPDTPFPELPAGALLLLELPPGATDVRQVRAVHLVSRGASSFVASEAADLYFVINDLWDGGDPDCQRLSPEGDPNRVSVTLRRALPNGEVVRQSVAGLSQVIGSLREQRGELLRQGRVLGAQLSALSAGAALDFAAVSGFELGRLPAVLRDLVDAFLRREVAAIEIAVERQTLERRVADIGLEIDALLAEARLLADGARIASLLPVWRLRTFDELADGSDEVSLLESARGLLESSSETLLPILEIWHADALSEARAASSFRRDASSLANLGPETDPFTLIDEVERLLQRLRDAYDTDPIAHLQDPLNQPIVGVSFPRPPEWQRPCPSCFRSESGFPRASAARSYAIWTAVEAALRSGTAVPERPCATNADCAGLPGTRCSLEASSPRCELAPTRVSLGVQPDDVYRASGGQATLACFLATPVVQQWALLFANQADDFDPQLRQLSQTGRRLDPRSRPAQPFVTELGILSYDITDPSSLTSGISLLYSSDEAAFSTFQSFANERLLQGRNPVGLSALAELSVDFAPLGSMSHSFGNGIGETADRPVSELILLMRLDAREFASDPPGEELARVVESCAREARVSLR